MTDDSSAAGTARPVMSADAVDAAITSARIRVNFDSLRGPSHPHGPDPNWPFPDGGAQAFWEDLMSGLEARWELIREADETPETEQQKLIADGGTSTSGTERTECWKCRYQRPTFEACPECGAYGGDQE